MEAGERVHGALFIIGPATLRRSPKSWEGLSVALRFLMLDQDLVALFFIYAALTWMISSD